MQTLTPARPVTDTAEPSSVPARDPASLTEGEGLTKALFAHMPVAAAESFTPDQRLALRRAAAQLRWGRHPVDIRLSVPTLLNRYYLVVIGGRERRNRDRRREESPRHRFNTWRNWLFLLALLGIAIYALGTVAAFILPWYWERLILQ